MRVRTIEIKKEDGNIEVVQHVYGDDLVKKAIVATKDGQELVVSGLLPAGKPYLHVGVGSRLTENGYLFGMRYLDNKLELLFDERERLHSDNRVRKAVQAWPADDESGDILKKVFENKAYRRVNGAGILCTEAKFEWPPIGGIGLQHS